MAALPWFIYVLVGILVSTYSRLVMNKQGATYPMKLFFYLGVVFFGIGMYRLLMQRLRAPGKNLKASVVVCTVCGTRNYVTSYYCHICGTQIKKRPMNRS